MFNTISSNNSSNEKIKTKSEDTTSYPGLGNFDYKIVVIQQTGNNISETRNKDLDIDFEINSSSSNNNIEDYDSQLEVFNKQFTLHLISIILEQEFEYGFESSGDKFIKEIMTKSRIITRTWLNGVFLDYFSKPRILIGILQIISHLPYTEIYPEGPTMAIAALKHTDAEVRETGVRCFENWGSPDTLNILENLRFNESWLQNYVNQVIEDLKPIMTLKQ